LPKQFVSKKPIPDSSDGIPRFPESPPPFAAHFVEIEVDTFTGIIRVLSYVATVDCGTAINPTLAEGQAQGAIVNGIAYALFENYYFSPQGILLNDTLENMDAHRARHSPNHGKAG